MEEMFYNADPGYFEGRVRGFRAGILKTGDYLNLCQCDNLDGSCHACVCAWCETVVTTVCS